MRAPPESLRPTIGAPDLHREIHDLADLLGVRLRQRAAEDREVLAEHEHEAAVDGAVAGDHAVAQVALLVEAEVVTRDASRTRRTRRTSPASSSSSSRSRAVSLPSACCWSMRSCPPPSRACARIVAQSLDLVAGRRSRIVLPSSRARTANRTAACAAPRDYPQNRWTNVLRSVDNSRRSAGSVW